VRTTRPSARGKAPGLLFIGFKEALPASVNFMRSCVQVPISRKGVLLGLFFDALPFLFRLSFGSSTLAKSSNSKSEAIQRAFSYRPPQHFFSGLHLSGAKIPMPNIFLRHSAISFSPALHQHQKPGGIIPARAGFFSATWLDALLRLCSAPWAPLLFLVGCRGARFQKKVHHGPVKSDNGAAPAAWQYGKLTETSLLPLAVVGHKLFPPN